MNRSKRLFLSLVVLAFAQTAYYYPQLPEIIASHFDGLGAANAWSGRAGFFAIYPAAVLMLVAIFVFVPCRAEKRARFGIKIPNREYWLAPGRIALTRALFRR